MNRNALLIPVVLLLAPLAGLLPAAESAPAKLSILFITADDMNHDSAGCYGCPIKDLTPNLDRLATEGMRFQYAYSTVAVCQPVRDHNVCHRVPGLPRNGYPRMRRRVHPVPQWGSVAAGAVPDATPLG